ncbi:DUF2848 domain-containing protein [Sinomonas sp. B1-1]|uniref:DUF2848 domain-containing protein n=1 Tax=Sinomonas sp. B1-1 TaxID=3141454 RepID=UPI003D28B85C
MALIRLDVVGSGPREIPISYVLNGGYAGRDTAQVQHHVDELAELGVPAPTTIPTLYPLSATQATQAGSTQVQHGRTSGEAEWALIVGDGPDDLLVTAACDHTDRDLEVHSVAWSKQAGPDVLGDVAWRLSDVEDALDGFSLRAWVTHDGAETLIQDGSPSQLLPPRYWADRLDEAGLLRPGTVVMSGTIPMVPGVDQFADGWRVELADGEGNVSRVAYEVEMLPAAWE